MTAWTRWVRQPQTLFLRKALFQIHLWTGIGVGLYVVALCASGSVLVYRNELYNRFSPHPVAVSGTGNPMGDDEIRRAALRAFPTYKVKEVTVPDANHAAEVTLSRGEETMRRLFHPYTGEDLGDPLPL